MILGGIPCSPSQSYAVVRYLLRMFRRLLIVLGASPFFSSRALYCSMCCVVIALIGVAPKDGVRHSSSAFFLLYCFRGCAYGGVCSRLGSLSTMSFLFFVLPYVIGRLTPPVVSPSRTRCRTL